MKPADMKKRFCATCKTHVQDLAAMTKREAKTLLASASTEGLCVRYLYDQHGEVVFSDDPRLVAPSALVRAKRFGLAAVAVALPMTLTACMGSRPASPPREPVASPTLTEPAASPAPTEPGALAEPVAPVAPAEPVAPVTPAAPGTTTGPAASAGTPATASW